MICFLLRLLTFRRKNHRWVVAWNDDDVCLRGCGATRYVPSNHVAQPWSLTREERRIHRANAQTV